MKFSKSKLLVFMLATGVVGIATLLFTRAATGTYSFEPESGSLQGSAQLALGGTAVKFGGGTVTPATVTPGAETNYDKLPYVPGTGRIVSVSANVGAIQNALNAAAPGDTIEVSDGTISGGITMNGNGTASSRIILRAKNKNGVTVTSCGGGCITMNGSYNVVQNFRFSGTGSQAVVINGDKDVLFENLFDNTGDGNSACCTALILIQKPDYANAQLVMANNMVLKNTFNNPRNAVLYNYSGAGGTVVSHNIINGPHGFNADAGEREALKFNCCGTDREPAGTYNYRVQFNSIYDWGDTSPYVSQFKRDGGTYAYNKIISTAPGNDQDHLETRGSNMKVVGNLMIGRDAGVFLSNGTNQLVKYNRFYATGMKYGKGGFQITGTGCYDSPTCGSWYNMAVATVSDNVFYNAEGYLVADFAGQDTQKAAGSTFTNNVFLRPNAGSWIKSDPFNGNGHVWQNNVFHCLSGCSDSSLNSGVIGITLGANGNRAGDPGKTYDPNDQNQQVPFDASYVAPY